MKQDLIFWKKNITNLPSLTKIWGELSVHEKKGDNSRLFVYYPDFKEQSEILCTVSRYFVTCIPSHYEFSLMNTETYLVSHWGHCMVQSIHHDAYLWSAYTAIWNISTRLFSDDVYLLRSEGMTNHYYNDLTWWAVNNINSYASYQAKWVLA